MVMTSWFCAYLITLKVTLDTNSTIVFAPPSQPDSNTYMSYFYHFCCSHGHIDHVSGIVQHAACRELYNMKPAVYYMPTHLVDVAHAMGQGFATPHGPDQKFTQLNIKTLNTGDC